MVLRAVVARAEDLCSVPGTTTLCNSSSKDMSPPSGSCWYCVQLGAQEKK